MKLPYYFSKLPPFTVLIFFCLLLTSCGGKSSAQNDADRSYEEQKLSLEEVEKQSPLRFLSTDGTYRSTLFGRWAINGTISSSATVATYKDVILEFSYYSKTNTLLGTERRVFYEYFGPGSTRSFNFKTDGKSGTSRVSWRIIDADSN